MAPYRLETLIVCLSISGLGAGYLLPRVLKARAAVQGVVTSRIADGAQQQIRALLAEKNRRTPAQQKIDSQLLYAIKMSRGEEIAPGIRQLNVNVEISDGRTVVDIIAIVGGTLIEDLAALGAEVTSVYQQYNSIRATVSLDQLEAVAALPQIRFIQPKQEPNYAGHFTHERPSDLTGRAGRIRAWLSEVLSRFSRSAASDIQAGSKTSEGDTTHRANAARAMFGANGAGVRVGVLSDGAPSLALSQATGDLPPNVTILPGYTGSGDEGTAMLEIIHDLAPGARLYFATAGGGPAGYAQAIRDLRAAGCDIIVDDVAYSAETPFQDGQAPNVVSTTNGGVIWQAVNDVTASGALYFAFAGNEGNKNDGTSSTWTGDFVDGGTLALVPGGTVHDFGGGQQFNTVTALASVASGLLFWSDRLGGSTNDYDLFVLNSTGTAVLSSSTNVQNGTQDPFELVGNVPNNGRLVVLRKTGAAARFLYLASSRGRLSPSTDGNVRGHACAANAFCVAATPAVDPGQPPNPAGPFPNPFNSSNKVELFSSDGPRRIFFNADGTAITPGNFLSTGGTLRQKPDITAADGVMVTGVGGFGSPFYGTSAASPHAGAIAALLKSVNPTLTAAQVRATLVSTAIDIESAGIDRDSGAGIVMAFEALQSIGAVPSVNLQAGTVAATEVGGNGNGFIEPGEAGTLSVQLLNTGPVGATNVNSMLSSTTPGVTVTTSASAYPNLPAATGSGINATNFAFTLSPAAVCPLRVDFALTVSFAGVGSPRVVPFTVQTGPIPLTITSTLDITDPLSGEGFTASSGLQTMRLNRTGSLATCGANRQCPGPTGTGAHRFDAYAFTNCTTRTSCIVATIGSNCSGGVFAAAYQGTFNPNSLCSNYLGDSGLSPTTRPLEFAFTVSAGATFTIVVSEASPNAGLTCPYTLNLSGLCCQGSTGSCATVSGLGSATAVIGSTVVINGSNFAGVTGLRFANGVSSALTIVNNNRIEAVIPAGAASGPLTLHKPGCADVQSPPLTVITCHTVSSINPTAGVVSGNVTIVGTNLTGVTGVRFANGVTATFTVNSDASINATVPAGAVTGPITVSKSICTDAQTPAFTVGSAEADVIPRPSGNGIVSVTDWVQVGRFASGLDVPGAGSELQRADCAPVATRGDGRVTALDFMQAGRYVALFDLPILSAGPTTPTPFSGYSGWSDTSAARRDAQGRTVRAVNASIQRGQQGTVGIQLDSQGNENALSFSLNFDPTELQYVSSSSGADAGSATLMVNTSQVGGGRIIVALALPTGQTFAAGARQVFTARFTALANGLGATTSISFGDQPVVREVSDAAANALTSTYVSGTVTLVRALATVSAANFAGPSIAAEAIAAAFGINLATSTVSASSSPLPIELSGTTVTVKDSAGTERPSPLFFVSPAQINLQIPPGSVDGPAMVTVRSGNGTISTGTIQIVRAAPGIFTANSSGQGLAAALALRVRADGSSNFEDIVQFDTGQGRFVAVPIDLGPATDQVFLVLFGTGIRFRTDLGAVVAQIGGTGATVLYAGLAPGFTGLDQINLSIARTLIGRGEVDVGITVDSKAANTVRIAIK